MPSRSPWRVVVLGVSLALAAGGGWWIGAQGPGTPFAAGAGAFDPLWPALMWALAGTGFGWLLGRRPRRPVATAAAQSPTTSRALQTTASMAPGASPLEPGPQPAGPGREPLRQRLRHTLTLADSPVGEPFALVALAVSPRADAPPGGTADGQASLAEAVSRRLQPLLRPGEAVAWEPPEALDDGAAGAAASPRAPLQALVLMEELDADAMARLPARLRAWQAELSEPCTVQDHPVPVLAAVAVVDRPLAASGPGDRSADAAPRRPEDRLCDEALALARAALVHAVSGSHGEPPPRDARSTGGVWFHTPAFSAWRARRDAAERRVADWLAPGALRVRLQPVVALGDDTPAGWVASWAIAAGGGTQPDAEGAGALTDDPKLAEGSKLALGDVSLAGRRRVAQAAWAQALRTLESQDPNARDTWVSVTVPDGLWLDAGLADLVRAACEAAAQPPARLDLLLDESVVAAQPDAAARQLQAVRATGARITLVGLTQGAGSLSWLARLPLTAVRLDARLVHDLPLRETAHLLVRAIVQLAAERRQMVWAEAATTASQRRALRDAGVTWAHAGTSGPGDDASSIPDAAPPPISRSRSSAAPA